MFGTESDAAFKVVQCTISIAAGTIGLLLNIELLTTNQRPRILQPSRSEKAILFSKSIATNMETPASVGRYATSSKVSSRFTAETT